MTPLASRLKELTDATGWDVGEIAEHAGVSSSAVSQWMGKGSKVIHSIGIKAASNLERKTGFRAMWLSNGELPKMVNGTAATLSATLTAPAMLMSASGGPTLLGVGTQSIAGLGAALAYVASTMLMADDLVKIQAKPLLALLIEKPEQAEKIIPRLVALLEGDFLTTETKDFIHAKQPS